MRNMDKEIIFILIITYLSSINAQDIKAEAIKLEALMPRGLRVSMKDNGYYVRFKFIGSLKRQTETKKWETYYESRAKNSDWVFTDRYYDMRIGDHLTYSIFAIKNRGLFDRIDGEWTVSEYVMNPEILNCNFSETETLYSKRHCRGTLIFSDEFDNTLNENWLYEHMFPQGPDYPFNAYTNLHKRISESGPLIIEPGFSHRRYQQTWDMGYACTGEPGTSECRQKFIGPQILPPVASGKASTRKLFSFKYGRIDIRAKLPEGDWLIPEINLEPLNCVYGRQHYGSGLIRIAYVRGNEEYNHELYGGPVVCDKEPCRSSYLRKSPIKSSPWNKHFHVFSLIWKPDGFELLVDDELYGEVKPYDAVVLDNNSFKMTKTPHSELWKKENAMSPFDELFYISLGVRVGGINDFVDTPGKPWVNSSPKAMFKFWKDSDAWRKTWTAPKLIVDYVRVYAL